MKSRLLVLTKRWVSNLTPKVEDVCYFEQSSFLTYISPASVLDLNAPIPAQWQGIYSPVLDALNHAPLQAKSNIERP
jgi:hypothetical protein